jgi:hypothetical protein
VLETICDGNGGDFQGEGVTCELAECPQPPGACCFDDGTCTDVTEEECDPLGGDYQGAFTLCEDQLCGTGTFLGLQVEEDLFALDGETLLEDIGITGVRVFNIYAAFTNVNDQATGVVGNPDNPFSVFTSDGSGFINDTQFGDDRPPQAEAAEFFPSLNADSFYTIGNRELDVGPLWSNGDEFTDNVVVAPMTPGPNMDPWGDGNDNMAWVVRPSLPPPSGGPAEPTPQTVAGNWPDNRVLLMRLVVNEGVDVAGTFGLLVNLTNGPQTKLLAFFSTGSSPACPGEGNCFEPNGTPGCEDQLCCDTVCVADPNCCDVAWDTTCAELAIDFCQSVPVCCLGNGDCVEISQDECAMLDGVPLGGTCSIIECSSLPGACCLEEGCEQLVVDTCIDNAGLFQGFGSVCEDVGCEFVCVDTNGDGVVDVVDLINVILWWGVCPPDPPCPADINGDYLVDRADLVAIVLGWGECP